MKGYLIRDRPEGLPFALLNKIPILQKATKAWENAGGVISGKRYLKKASFVSEN